MSGHVFVAGPASWNQIVMLDALPQPVSHMAFARSHRWALGGTSAGKALNLRSLGVDVTLRTVVGDDPEGRQVLMALHESGIDVLAEKASNRSRPGWARWGSPRRARCSGWRPPTPW